jgi:hypothetical protein
MYADGEGIFMSFETRSPLPRTPPDLLDFSSRLKNGAYHGSVAAVDLQSRLGAGITGRMGRLLKLKRWVWGCVATQDVYVGFALIDAGLASSGFAFAVDLKDGKTVSDQSVMGSRGALTLVDRPGEGLYANFESGRMHMQVARPTGSSAFKVTVQSPELVLKATLESGGAPDPLAVLMQVRDGDLDFTQKATLLAAHGEVRCGSRRWDLEGGFGGLDYTHGLFARKTEWRWAFALGRSVEGVPVALNLADGITDDIPGENAIWIGQQLSSTGAAAFHFDAEDPIAAWDVRTMDGAVRLLFRPKGLHREDRNYLVIKSHFAQVAGYFSGTIVDPAGRTHRVENLPGVAEDQRVLW